MQSCTLQIRPLFSVLALTQSRAVLTRKGWLRCRNAVCRHALLFHGEVHVGSLLSLGDSNEMEHVAWQWHSWGLYLSTSTDSPLSSYEVRFFFFPPKHALAKWDGFSERWYKAHPWSRGQSSARFQALLQSMGMLQWFQEEIARTFKFGQNAIFFPSPILERPKLMDQKVKKK